MLLPLKKQPYDFNMVAPSCCLEYRPTAYFWVILLFVVFPSIYLCGKVVGCFITVFLRVLRGLCRFLLWDDADYEEVAKTEAAEREAEILRLVEEREIERAEERRRRREEKKKLREELRMLQEKTEKSLQANGKASKVMMNGKSKDDKIVEEKNPPSDNSDSLISECEDETSQATSGVVSETKSQGSTHLRHRNLQHKRLQ